MKKLKISVLLLSFMLLLSSAIMAQGMKDMSASDRAAKLTDWMPTSMNS